jgi:hypothetical protein
MHGNIVSRITKRLAHTSDFLLLTDVNIRDWYTRSHPSKEEDHIRNRILYNVSSHFLLSLQTIN